jgi:hypothetical protein
MTNFAVGKKARGLCDICGQAYLLKKLKEVIRKANKTGLLACPSCWDPDHPQLMLGQFPVDDPQALRNPRPDSAELAQVRARILPVNPVVSFGQVGEVTIVII